MGTSKIAVVSPGVVECHPEERRRISTMRMPSILNVGLTKAWLQDGEYLAEEDIGQNRGFQIRKRLTRVFYRYLETRE